MSAPAYDLHVFGLNLSGIPNTERAELGMTPSEIARVLESLAVRHPRIEAVVVRARNHVEAFVAAPAGSEVVRVWVSQLRRIRPDLLHEGRRPLHYHMSGLRAETHLHRLAAGRYAPSDGAYAQTDGATSDGATSVYAGLKAALALAARCGTLGETLDALFVRGLEQIHSRRIEARSADQPLAEAVSP